MTAENDNNSNALLHAHAGSDAHVRRKRTAAVPRSEKRTMIEEFDDDDLRLELRDDRTRALDATEN